MLIKNQNGFSLKEFLIALLLIFGLFALAIPAYYHFKSTQPAQETAKPASPQN